MRTIYKATAAEAVETMVDDVVQKHGVTKATARKLIINALLYNCVQEEIFGQVEFLLDSEEDE